MTDAELTRLAAAQVMKWNWIASMETHVNAEYPLFSIHTDAAFVFRSRDQEKMEPWQPLTDWSAAGEIVAKMRTDGWFPGVQSGPKLIDGKWARVVRVRWGKEKKSGTFTSADFPRAITIAALLAVGAIPEGGPNA